MITGGVIITCFRSVDGSSCRGKTTWKKMIPWHWIILEVSQRHASVGRISHSIEPIHSGEVFDPFSRSDQEAVGVVLKGIKPICIASRSRHAHRLLPRSFDT